MIMNQAMLKDWLRWLSYIVNNNNMKRILSVETIEKVGEEVLLKGWVDARRNMGKIVFLDLRDFKGKVQVVAVPAELVEKEKEIYTEQLKKEGKPENIIENILKGKINKFYGEVCLVEQMYVQDDKKKVKEILPEGSEIKEYVRIELGEGIEKKKCDFVAEVQEQIA